MITNFLVTLKFKKNIIYRTSSAAAVTIDFVLLFFYWNCDFTKRNNKNGFVQVRFCVTFALQHRQTVKELSDFSLGTFDLFCSSTKTLLSTWFSFALLDLEIVCLIFFKWISATGNFDIHLTLITTMDMLKDLQNTWNVTVLHIVISTKKIIWMLLPHAKPRRRRSYRITLVICNNFEAIYKIVSNTYEPAGFFSGHSIKWIHRIFTPNDLQSMSLRSTPGPLRACSFILKLYRDCQKNGLEVNTKRMQIHYTPYPEIHFHSHPRPVILMATSGKFFGHFWDPELAPVLKLVWRAKCDQYFLKSFHQKWGFQEAYHYCSQKWK